MCSSKPQKSGSSSANKGKGKEVQNTEKQNQASAFQTIYPSRQGVSFRPPSFVYPAIPTQHRSHAHVQPPSPPAPQEQPTHVPPSHHAWELEFANSTTGMSYMNMLNEVSQIPLADLGELHGHHSATSSAGPSTPESDNDDIQQPEVKKHGRAPRPKKLPIERGPDGKPYAEPTKSGFGETTINKIITNILIGFLGTAAYATWHEVDDNTRGQMLKEFMSKVHIRPGITEAQVRIGFGAKCSARWREITNRIKGDYKPPRHDAEGQTDLADQQNQEDQPDQSTQEHGPIFPSWVQSALMEALFVRWHSKAFQDLSDRNKQNRGSGEGCSVHTGGSLTFQGHRRKMKIVDGAPVSIDRVYKQTHTHQFVDGVRLHDDEIKPWARSKYQKIHEGYQEKRAKWCEESSSSPDCGDKEPPKEVQDQMWIEVSGGPKHGKICGVGSLIPGTTPRTEIPSLSDMNVLSASQNVEIHKEVKKQVKDAKGAMAKKFQGALAEFAQQVANSNGQPVRVPILNFDDDNDGTDVGSVGGGHDDDYHIDNKE